MKRISYKRHRFPPDIIQFAVWAYFRFTSRRLIVKRKAAQTANWMSSGRKRRRL